MEPSPPTVLVTDDDPTDRMLLRRTLRALVEGVRVETAQDGAELLASLREREAPPDLILLDLNMPGMDGATALQALRDAPELRRGPIIVFTTSSAPSDRERCLALGADGFVTKPSTLAELRERVAEIVARWLP